MTNKQIKNKLKKERLDYLDVVEFPPLGDAFETHENNPKFFAKWAKGEIEELKNIPHKDVVKVICYSDSQAPVLEPNRAVVVYKDCSVLILVLAHGEQRFVTEVVTYAEQIDQANSTRKKINKLKV